MKNFDRIPAAWFRSPEDNLTDLTPDLKVESEKNAPAPQPKPEGKESSVIPKAIVSADTVGDLINSLRGEEEKETPAPQPKPEGKENSVIPKAIVSADTVGDLINSLRGEDEKEAPAPQPKPEGKENSVIPKAIVSADSELDRLHSLLTSGQEIRMRRDGTLAALDEDDPTEPEHPQCIPKAVVSATQWYVTNPALRDAEIQNMRREFGDPNLMPHYAENGNMYWTVSVRPNLGPGYHTSTYKLMLMYDSDHPKARYGSSVKVYPISPSLEEMQNWVNHIPAIPEDEKGIPHTLPDPSGNLYLCTVDARQVSDDLHTGITSAVTSYRLAYRWLTILELGMRHLPTWRDFKEHGRI